MTRKLENFVPFDFVPFFGAKDYQNRNRLHYNFSNNKYVSNNPNMKAVPGFRILEGYNVLSAALTTFAGFKILENMLW